MDLSRALRLKPGWKVAFTGSGGKTSAMFTLARLLPPPVLVTATTHLGHDQLVRADVHYTVTSPGELPAPEELAAHPVTLLVGPPAGGWRTSGLDAVSYRQLARHAQVMNATLLVEADGSRQLPLKAPGSHEPPIPEDVDAVVVVAGMLGYRKPFNANFVHRLDQYAILSGLLPDETILLPQMAEVLRHPQGGLKNIPAQSEKRLLLNQADTPQLQAAGGELARLLLPEFRRVVVAALAPAESGPIPQGNVLAAFGQMGAVLLAAGAGSRYGKLKQLLDWHGVPFVRAIALTALQAGLELVVVTGYQGERVTAAVQDLPLKIVHNPNWESGQGSSIRAGVQALPDGTEACIFLHSDQPQVPLRLLLSLIETYAAEGSSILAPLVDGERSTPVLFDRELFAELAQIQGDRGGRELFARYKLDYLPWHEPSLRLDVDTPETYARLKDLG